MRNRPRKLVNQLTRLSISIKFNKSGELVVSYVKCEGVPPQPIESMLRYQTTTGPQKLKQRLSGVRYRGDQETEKSQQTMRKRRAELKHRSDSLQTYYHKKDPPGGFDDGIALKSLQYPYPRPVFSRDTKANSHDATAALRQLETAVNLPMPPPSSRPIEPSAPLPGREIESRFFKTTGLLRFHYKFFAKPAPTRLKGREKDGAQNRPSA